MSVHGMKTAISDHTPLLVDSGWKGESGTSPPPPRVAPHATEGVVDDLCFIYSSCEWARSSNYAIRQWMDR